MLVPKKFSAQAFIFLITFQLFSISNRILTPNGDGRNDIVTFVLNNPADVAVTGKVYSLRGIFLGAMAPGKKSGTLFWDGRAYGAKVPTGVYIYRLQGEKRVITGSLVVIR